MVDRFAAVGPRAVRGRRRLSRALGRLPLPEAQVVGGQRERWTCGFLFDAVLTRDTWMHRTDISRAVGRELELTREHDGLLIADVVAEWAQRHGRPLASGGAGEPQAVGPAGERGEELELDAVDFCRLLSGRGKGAGLLGQQVPF